MVVLFIKIVLYYKARPNQSYLKNDPKSDLLMTRIAAISADRIDFKVGKELNIT